MNALQHADRIMALPPGSYVMAVEPVRVTYLTRGGTILLQPGDRIRLSSCGGQSAWGYTERAAEHVAFGMEAAQHFEPAPVIK